jgi:hypothetical protein
VLRTHRYEFWLCFAEVSDLMLGLTGMVTPQDHASSHARSLASPWIVGGRGRRASAARRQPRRRSRRLD